jgi:hypothetical protein
MREKNYNNSNFLALVCGFVWELSATGIRDTDSEKIPLENTRFDDIFVSLETRSVLASDIEPYRDFRHGTPRFARDRESRHRSHGNESTNGLGLGAPILRDSRHWKLRRPWELEHRKPTKCLNSRTIFAPNFDPKELDQRSTSRAVAFLWRN